MVVNNPDNTIIELKEAVQSARRYFAELFPEDSYQNLRLEEVALSSDGNTWNITLGFDVAVGPYPEFMGEGYRFTREYKIFEIDAHDGTVRSMKIRKV